MESLSTDLLLHITSFLKNQNHLLNFKLSYKFVNSILTNKIMLTCQFKQYTKRKLCINKNCYEDTWEIFTHVHNYCLYNYKHKHQEAINERVMGVGSKRYTVVSPYCVDCFISFVLSDPDPGPALVYASI
jgi:hypothetical protein